MRRVKRERDQYVDEVRYWKVKTNSMIGEVESLKRDAVLSRRYREASPVKPEFSKRGGRMPVRSVASRSPSVSPVQARARSPVTPDYSPRREKEQTPSHPFSNMRLRQLRDLAKDIEAFDPSARNNNIETYIKDINYSLRFMPDASSTEKVMLIRKTTVRAVHEFMERQGSQVCDDYDRLCEALTVSDPSPAASKVYLIGWGEEPLGPDPVTSVVKVVPMDSRGPAPPLLQFLGELTQRGQAKRIYVTGDHSDGPPHPPITIDLYLPHVQEDTPAGGVTASQRTMD
ncbi:hypothetical protein SKAU_G00234550 [Synaphobranchus kaupii]|uniref:Uncharacterized protein n=1 Tax=Synaphobranchus kaupii TaxID=118154 RepID=A0A9Q1F6C6_SYNKA|nr:hypothetical protein SKAU_G00234550 [Synaphobranchus kaupii]